MKCFARRLCIVYTLFFVRVVIGGCGVWTGWLGGLGLGPRRDGRSMIAVRLRLSRVSELR